MPSPRLEGRPTVLWQGSNQFVIQVTCHINQVLSIVWLAVSLRVVQFNSLTTHVNSDEYPVHVANVDRDVQDLQPVPSVLCECTYPPAPSRHIVVAVVSSRWSELGEEEC